MTRQLPNMVCNDTCCSYGGGLVMCFSDYNFTDKSNLTQVAPWELGVRWTFTILVTAIGFFGNLAIIIILSKNRLLLRTSVNRFILNMSCADFILTCLGPVLFTIRETHQFYTLGELWCHMDGYIQILVMVVSAASLSVISCDRMLGISRPFHRHLKTWQSDVIIVVIWILSAAFAVPFMFYRVFTVRKWKDVTEKVCGEDWSEMRIWWIFTIVVLIWIPVGIMLISYTSILIFLKYSKWRPKNTEHPAIMHLKRRVINMMFIVVLGFVICWGPFQGSRIIYYFYTENGRYTDPKAGREYEIFSTISQYLLYVNPAFNPIVYGLMHQTFRRAFKMTFSCFYNKKSAFMLTRGQGPHRYAWSLCPSTSAAYGQDLEANLGRSRLRQKIFSRRQPSRTPTALLATSATVAAIALDPFNNSTSSSHRNEKENPNESITIPNDFEIKREIHSKTGKAILTIVNEGYVSDLPQCRGRSIASTGALGHLITQVIKEETSSDVASERIL